MTVTTTALANSTSGAGGGSSALLDAHVAAADPHPQYALESTIGQPSGIASLGADGKVPAAQLPTAGSGSAGAVGDAFTMPQLSAFSWLNQGEATATQETFGVTLIAPSFPFGDTLRTLIQPLSNASTFTLTVRANGVIPVAFYTAMGICLYDSVSGKIESYGPTCKSGSVTLAGIRWNNPTSYNADISGRLASSSMDWLRLRDNGTTRFMEVSSDGKNWVKMYSFPRGDFIPTPTHVGFFVNPNGGDAMITVLSWKQT